MKPVAEFRAYFDRNYWVVVTVYRTLGDARRAHPGTFSARTRGCFIGGANWRHSESGRTRRTGYVGTIILSATCLTCNVLAHESGHAVWALMRRRGWREVDEGRPDYGGLRAGPLERSAGRRGMENEERFCYPLGELMSSIVLGLQRFDLL